MDSSNKEHPELKSICDFIRTFKPSDIRIGTFNKFSDILDSTKDLKPDDCEIRLLSCPLEEQVRAELGFL